MSDFERLIKCNYHLGDTAGAFPESPYVGLSLRLPILLPKPSDFSGDVTLKIAAEELFGGGYYEHQVLVVDKRVGALGITDPDTDEKGRFQFTVSRQYVIEIHENNIVPTFSVHNDHIGNNLSDDFIITGYGVKFVKT